MLGFYIKCPKCNDSYFLEKIDGFVRCMLCQNVYNQDTNKKRINKFVYEALKRIKGE